MGQLEAASLYGLTKNHGRYTRYHNTNLVAYRWRRVIRYRHMASISNPIVFSHFQLSRRIEKKQPILKVPKETICHQTRISS